MTKADGELISFRPDKGINGLPREGMARRLGKSPRQPALWAHSEALDYDPPGAWGAYPKGFVAWACRALRANPGEVLHVCSGSLARGQGFRVDLRAAALPDVAADGAALPFRDATFPAAMLDPPYSVEYAADLYGTEYPRPSALLAEAARCVAPGGRLGILHFLVPMPPPACALERVYGITTGCGYRVRAFTVFVKEQPALDFGARG